MRYAFGAFELDTDGHTLSRDGQGVAVQPKVFQLIAHLIAERARYVSKRELLAALWPAEHVTDSSLYVSIRAARLALGQDGEEGPIAMLRGAGYRFVAEVIERGGVATKHAPSPARAPAPDPFVGRERALVELIGALDAAVQGRAGFVLLCGEPGIGKTRCARELVQRAEAREVPVLSARCPEGEGAPALWPFVQLLRQAAERDAGVAAEVERALERIVPVRAQGEASLLADAPQERAIDRFWIFDHVARALHTAAQARGLVIVLDDLQWADEASLRQLERCVTEPARTRTLVVATLRAPRSDAEPARERVLRRLERQATVIELGRLSADETQELVRQLRGEGDPARLATELHGKTAGNPFFLRELLRALADVGGDRAGSADSITRLPGVVRDMILARLEGLEPAAVAVLRAASVLGSEVEEPLLRAALELPAERFLLALEALVERGLLTRTAELERCAFDHDLVREVVYQQIDSPSRVRLHRRVAEVMEARGDRSPIEIAHHYHEALAGGAHAQVLRWAALAGAQHTAALAFESAERCYRWALSALDFERSADARTRAQLMLQLGVAILSSGRSAEAIAVLQDAARIADRGDHGDLLALIATWLRHNVALAPLPDPFALGLLERAQSLLADDQPALRAQVLSRLAWIWPHCEDMSRCKALAEQALALADRAGGTRTRLDALTALLYAHSGPDDGDALLATADEIFATERAAGRAGWAGGQAQFMRYHALVQRAERAPADRALGELAAFARQLKLSETTLMCDRMKAQQAMDAGRFDEAAAGFAEQHARGKRLGLHYADLYYVLQLLALQWEREGLAELPAAPASAEWDITRTALFRATRLFVAACSGTRRAEHDEELEQLSRAGFAAVPRDLNYLVTMCLLAHVAFVREDLPRARALYAALAPYAGRVTISLLSQTAGAVAGYLGELARLLGQPAEAARHFEDALAINARMGLATWTVRTKVAYAEALAGTREPADAARARTLLQQSEAEARALGLSPLSARIAGLLGS